MAPLEDEKNDGPEEPRGRVSGGSEDLKVNSSSDEHKGDEKHAIPEPQDTAAPVVENAPSTKSLQFWLIMLCLGLTVFAASSDLSILFTALPTILDDIGSDASRSDYVWINSAYLVTGTVFIPMLSQLSNIFGRRWPTICSIAFFTLGSGISGGANGPRMLIAGRALQGVGFGGTLLFLDVLIADLLPVRERQMVCRVPRLSEFCDRVAN